MTILVLVFYFSCDRARRAATELWTWPSSRQVVVEAGGKVQYPGRRLNQRRRRRRLHHSSSTSFPTCPCLVVVVSGSDS